MPAASAHPPDQPDAANADAALLARIAAGDQTAFAVLYDRHSAPLYRRTRRLLGEREAAEDAVQTAFLNVWRGAGTFTPARGDAGAWLMASASHAALDQLRGRAGRARGDVPLDALAERAVPDDPHAAVAPDEHRHLTEALRLYQRVSEAATAGITISDCRLPDLPLVYANPAFLRMSGYTLAEVVGRNCRFLQGRDTTQPGLVTLRAALRAGRDCAVLLQNYRKGGELFWNELTMAPVRDEAGVLTHYIGIQTEVTARVAAEAALHRANDELEGRVAARTAALTAANAALVVAQYETLDRLARAAEARDDDTGQHTARVGATSALLAAALGWPNAAADRLGRAAVLHDVGKIGIPDGVLLKPGPLTPAEFAVMRAHTTGGAAILAGSDHPLLQLAEAIALGHHERWDGAGYPQGLVGDATPVAGRIVAVADVFDALTHARPYKAAWPIAAAVAEIARQAGGQFDPAVVAAFLALHQRGALS